MTQGFCDFFVLGGGGGCGESSGCMASSGPGFR